MQLLSKYDQLPVAYKVMETTESCVTYKGVHVANNTVASSNPCTRKKMKKKFGGQKDCVSKSSPPSNS